jgi:hypothetical protein
MKVCSVCKTEKEESNFSINKTKSDGLNIQCKECQKSYFKEYYKKNKQKQIARVNKTRLSKKNKIAKIKIESGCVRCGYNKHPAALHFHHVDTSTKTMNISCNLHHDIKDLLKEIEKCEVLCANCHAEEHSNYDWTEDIHIKPTKKRKENNKIINFSRRKLYVKKTEKINWPSKEELEKIVWEKPSEEIAKELDVSGSMLSKKCKQLGIDKPPRGYWQKIKSRKI